jgi:D-galactarolactone isomerase
MSTTPQTEIPALAADCHMHVYGPAERYPVAPSNLSPVPFAHDLAAYQAVKARLGLGRTVVVQPSAYGLDNSATLDAVAALSERLFHATGDSTGDDQTPGAARAVVAVTPETSDAELQRLHAAGARGARAVLLKHPLVAWEDLARLGARVAPLGWHIQMQFDGMQMEAREALIRALPCQVVIDHIGRFHEPVTPDSAPVLALRRLLESGRVWMKASSPYGVSRSADWSDTSAIARALIAAAPERVVWGSNWPHPNEPEPKPDEARVLDWLASVCPSEAVRQAVLVANPARLYDF